MNRDTPHFWSAKFVVSNVVLIILALSAAIFEYVIYPGIMQTEFGETSLTLNLSAFTYQYSAVRCYGNGLCPTLVGPPALDFFQIFLVAAVVYDAFRFLNHYRSNSKEARSY